MTNKDNVSKEESDSQESPELETRAIEENAAQEADQGQASKEASPESEARPEGDAKNEELAKLTEALESANASIENLQNRILRMQAEMENTRKRLDQKADDARRYGQKSMVEELLPVCDSMEMGVAAANEEGAEIGKIREGYELTARMLAQLLAKFNVEEINPVGEKFDPELHQAMSMQEGSGQEPNTVVTVMQKGYTLNSRLIRPALVMVAK